LTGVAQKVAELNWSWTINKHHKGSGLRDMETLSDFDSMALNLEAMNPNPDKLLYLENGLVVDIFNQVAYKEDCQFGYYYQLERTETNDRSRSTRSSLKPYDLTAVLQSANTDFFA
jgi:hypothetical protein